MLSTDKAWKRFGESEPYFGVLADQRFRVARIENNRDLFFASGESAVAHILGRFQRHFGPLARGRALDHGCGVGRLSFALARRFKSVTALDVAPSMLAEARANAERFGIPDIEFAQCNDTLSIAKGPFDFVNSYMVLQHIPVRRGLRVIDGLLAKVTPGGGFHLHVSIRCDRAASRALWWASHHVPCVKLWQNICAGRRWNAPAMQMNNYPLNRIAPLLASRGIAEFLISTEKHDKFLTLSIMGRVPQ